MVLFKKEILQQIEQIDTGRIFTFRDLSFPNEKMANVAVLLLIDTTRSNAAKSVNAELINGYWNVGGLY